MTEDNTNDAIYTDAVHKLYAVFTTVDSIKMYKAQLKEAQDKLKEKEAELNNLVREANEILEQLNKAQTDEQQ